jgi:hypothetical protein
LIGTELPAFETLYTVVLGGGVVHVPVDVTQLPETGLVRPVAQYATV